MSILLKKPLIIAGPCSAESEEQLAQISSDLNRIEVDIIRAGIWKPRTRPGAFDGVGAPGLQWISEIKKKTHLKFAIEVATPGHVELALRSGIDVLWIGSRSTANPFTVQSIADALKGVDVPVLVKNPINPDISLWMGALERLNIAGIKQLGAIHRGFSTNQNSKYRNLPLWRIPIDLKSKLSHIPLFCDPSHIAGNKELIREIAQKSIDLDYDGLMLEVHPDPINALSDAQQQLTPIDFFKLLNQMQYRQSKSSDIYFVQFLEKVREEIDQLDREIVSAVEARMILARKAGLHKMKHNITAFQLERWQEILESRPKWITEQYINPELIRELFKIIHDESLKMQLKIMEENSSMITNISKI